MYHPSASSMSPSFSLTCPDSSSFLSLSLPGNSTYTSCLATGCSAFHYINPSNTSSHSLQISHNTIDFGHGVYLRNRNLRQVCTHKNYSFLNLMPTSLIKKIPKISTIFTKNYKICSEFPRDPILIHYYLPCKFTAP